MAYNPVGPDDNLFHLGLGVTMIIEQNIPYALELVYADGTSKKSAVVADGQGGVVEKIEADNFLIAAGGEYVFSNDNFILEGA